MTILLILLLAVLVEIPLLQDVLLLAILLLVKERGVDKEQMVEPHLRMEEMPNTVGAVEQDFAEDMVVVPSMGQEAVVQL